MSKKYLFILFFLKLTTCHFETYAIQQHRGDSAISMHISSIQLIKDEQVFITGKWGFNWLKLNQSPSVTKNTTFLEIQPKGWTENGILPSFGYGTYFKTIVLPKDNKPLALLIPPIYSANKVFINGKLISENGQVGVNQKATKHRRFRQLIPLMPVDSTIDIVIQVANFYHSKGGITSVPVIGNYEKILKAQNEILIADMIYIGSLGFVSLSFLMLYLFFWNKDKAIFYFAIFCMAWSYRTLSEGYAPLIKLFPSLSWSVNSLIEYISLFAGALMGSLFFNEIFKKQIHYLYPKIIKYITYAFILIAVFINSEYMNNLLPPFFMIMGINISYITIILLRSTFKSKDRESLLALVSILSAVIILTAHILDYYDHFENGAIYINIGYVLVFLLVSMLLGMRFSRSFFTLERLQKETALQKEEIIMQSASLKTQNSLIEKLNKNLEKIIDKRTKSLQATYQELDKFLYKSSHDLSRPIKSIQGLINIYNSGQSTAYKESIIKKIEFSTNQMQDLLSKLHDVHQINNHIKQNEAIEMKIFINTILNHIEKDLGLKEKLKIKTTTPNTLFFDKSMMQQLLYQTLKNSAIWLLYENKLEIELTIKESDSRKIAIIIEDNGPGIPKEEINKVFLMYHVSNSITKTDGLGLYICSKIVEKLEGTISIESEQNEKTNVTIILPTSTVI